MLQILRYNNNWYIFTTLYEMIQIIIGISYVGWFCTAKRTLRLRLQEDFNEIGTSRG